MELSKKQQEAIDLVAAGKNVFITGNAGTGKSFLLKHIKEIIPEIQLTASTGIASINIGGQTLHSWSGIGLGDLPIDKIKINAKVLVRIRKTKVLAIDEISMISAETFDLVNKFIKYIRRNDKPFGGIQVIIFGDFFQLPPVKGDFCFNSAAWNELNLSYVFLDKIYRQIDMTFVNLLEHVRYATLTPEDIELLTSRITDKKDAMYTILVSHNSQADLINKTELDKIDGTVHKFKAVYRGTDQNKIDFLKKNCIAHDSLELKVGAHVMMLKNTYRDQGIVNGSVGIVESCDIYPVVMFEGNVKITVIPETWCTQRYDKDLDKIITEASMEQIPLLLSWAITIHKSQGMTLKSIKCDLSKVFTNGQSYVALSRVTTLDGLFIEDIDFDKIKTSQAIVDFYHKNNIAL